MAGFLRFHIVPLIFYYSATSPLRTIKKKKCEKGGKNNNRSKKEGGSELSITVSADDPKKKECIQCRKKLTLFDEYCHPTLGKDALLCWDCYEKVWESVVRWERFIAWNSFDPETPDPTYIDNFPFPNTERTIRHKKTKHPVQLVIP